MKQLHQRAELADGFSISRVLTGLWQIADMERDGASLDLSHAASAMAPYVAAGLTSFDMADHYGSAEEIVGLYRGMAEARPIETLTKWVPTPGPIDRRQVREAVDRACARMATERLELLQFHAWSYSDPSYLDALFLLQEQVSEGAIQHLGLTNCDAAHWQMLLDSDLPVVSNQVSSSLLDRRSRGALAALCSCRNVHLLAYGTLAGGFLTDKWLGVREPAAEDLETWSQMKYKRFIDVAGGWDRLQHLLQVLQRVADRRGVSMASVATRYVLDQPGVAAVIVGARLGRSEHIADTLQMLELRLDDRDSEELENAAAEFDPIPGDCGDEYRRPPFLTASGDLSHHVDGFPSPFPVERSSDGVLRASSGVSWEEMAGYCRALRRGDRVYVAGTTASHGDRLIGGASAASQALFALDKIEASLQSLGARLEDVVRTRVYVPRIEDWEAVARVHGDRFRSHRPANTLIRADLIGDEFLVEIEADAIVGEVLST